MFTGVAPGRASVEVISDEDADMKDDGQADEVEARDRGQADEVEARDRGQGALDDDIDGIGDNSNEI